jgi:hypothetical protein
MLTVFLKCRDLYRSKLQDITFYVQPQKAFTTDEHDSFEEDTQDDGEGTLWYDSLNVNKAIHSFFFHL